MVSQDGFIRFANVEIEVSTAGKNRSHATAAVIKDPSAKITHLARVGAEATQLAADTAMFSTTADLADTSVDSRR